MSERSSQRSASPAKPGAQRAEAPGGERRSQGWTVLELLQWTTKWFEEKQLGTAGVPRLGPLRCFVDGEGPATTIFGFRWPPGHVVSDEFVCPAGR